MSISTRINEYKEAIGFATTLGSVAIALILLIVSRELSPVVQDIKELRMANAQFEKQIDDLATKEQVSNLDKKVNEISDQVKYIYQIHINK